jgi:hypothetical protein
MNLSCGNCKVIRSFSGQTPACDECGWVYAPERRSRIGVEVDAIKEIVSTAGKELAPLRWLIGILLVVTGAVLLIWVAISAIRWFWDHPLW